MQAVWFKYVSFFLVSVAVLLAVYYAFKRERVLNFIIKSFLDERGRPDSKKMSAFLCVIAFLLGFFIIIYYDKDHNPPEFYVYTLAGLIASFYGIREVSRYINAKNSNGGYQNGNGNYSNGNGNGNNGNGGGAVTDPNAQVNTTSQPDQANPDNQQQKF